MATKNTLQFGRKRPSPPSPPSHHRANLTLFCGTLTAAVFFIGSLSGTSLSGDARRVESALDAVTVMSTGVDEAPENNAPPLSSADKVRERLRETVRDASGEPFGYMDGRWNLWEYLGDVMATLLVGG